MQGHWDLCWALLPCCSSSVCTGEFPFPSPCSLAIPGTHSSLHLACPAQKPCICPGDHNTHSRNWDELGSKYHVRLCDYSSTKLIWLKKRGSVSSGWVNSPVIMEESFLNTSIVLRWWIFALVSAAEGFGSILHTSAHLCVLILLSQCIWNHCLSLLYMQKVGWPDKFCKKQLVSATNSAQELSFPLCVKFLSCKKSWSQMSKRNADHTALPCPGWSMDTSKFLYKAGHIPFCPSCPFLIVLKPRPCAWCQVLVVLSRSGGQWGLSQVTNSLRSRTELLCPGFGVVCPPAHPEMGGGLYSDELLKKIQTALCCQTLCSAWPGLQDTDLLCGWIVTRRCFIK